MMTSPTSVIKAETNTFATALQAVCDGKHITRPNWGNIYGLMIGEYLHIRYPSGHEKAGTHTWIVSMADITATDWIILSPKTN